MKMYVAEVRPRIRAELGLDEDMAGLHRRFEVTPGGQAQVDWGHEGTDLTHVGIVNVYSFHMTLSYARDPFCCFATSQDLATFFDCHRRAFAHFGGASTTGRRPWSSGMLRRAKLFRCIRRRSHSPAPTVSTSTFSLPSSRCLPAAGQGPGRAAGRHRPRPRPGGPGVPLDCRCRAGRRLSDLGADPAAAGPPHP